jgi:3-hydroxyisobutyrate dehydrogenase-like beta-hydroxyacid dehydrogenase
MSVRVAFIGLGAMGEPMATNLARRKIPLIVVAHRRREPVDRLVALGALEAPTPAAAAREADVVLLMLPGSDAVAQVAEGPDGLVAAMRSGATLVDCSTADPACSRALAERAVARGLGYVDAPVTRGVQGARDGKLAFYLGGEASTIDAVRPVLEAMGDTFFHMGPAGAGHATKIIVQALSYATVTLVNEALMLGDATGLPLPMLQQALLAGAGSKALESFGPRILSRQHAPARVAIGDACAHLDAARRMAEGKACARGVHAAAHELLSMLAGRGLARSDLAALAEVWPPHEQH